VDKASLADLRRDPTTREARWRATRERSTRGLMAFNRGDVLHLEGDAWAIQASQGGFWRVDLDAETCTCPDFEHFGLPNDVNCKHLFAVAIAHATRRGPRRSQRRPSCPSCFGGYVTINVEEDGQERDEAVPCRRCRR